MLTRQREFLQWVVGGFSTSALILGFVWLSENRAQVVAFATGETTRTPASSPASSPVSDSKPNTAKSKLATGRETPEKKASGQLQVSLSSPNGRQSDGTLSLSATIASVADLTDVKYEWTLPDGVSLVSGTDHGDLGSLTRGTPSSLQVVVQVPSQQTKHIVLHVFRDLGVEKFGQVAHYDTLNQDSINLALAVKRNEIQQKVQQEIQAESSRKPASTLSSQPGGPRRME